MLYNFSRFERYTIQENLKEFAMPARIATMNRTKDVVLLSRESRFHTESDAMPRMTRNIIKFLFVPLRCLMKINWAMVYKNIIATIPVKILTIVENRIVR